MNDAEYMKIAIELAKKGSGFVSPNPIVGAVIVKEGRVIGTGYHERYGGLHAERNALASCTSSAEGATLYVTLEPCCHYGKTPPCTEAILEHKLKRVVIGSEDPNPMVAGKGMELLRQHGVMLTRGILEEECNELNAVFFHFIRTKRPYVVMKYAMTMDGKIATYTGESKWITGDAARGQVQKDRGRYRGIMAGVGTVLTDDPLLTCRLPERKSPVRIICDTNLRTPLSANVIKTAKQIPTILATSCGERKKQQGYLAAGCSLLEVPRKGAHIDLWKLMEQLGERNIDSILLEGGSTINWAALESGIVQKVQAYIAPKLFGGAFAKSPIGGAGVKNPASAYRLFNTKVIRLEGDILLESEVINDVYRNH